MESNNFVKKTKTRLKQGQLLKLRNGVTSRTKVMHTAYTGYIWSHRYSYGIPEYLVSLPYSYAVNRHSKYSWKNQLVLENIQPNYTYFFYKQPVYKQLVLQWQIAKQLSGLNLLSLSNNKSYRLKKGGVFPL